MNNLATRRSTILVRHPDPLLRAGLAAALRQHARFETFVDVADDAISSPCQVDVVITDYEDAIHACASAHPIDGALAVARILVLTTNDREVDIRRAISAGIHGYIILGGPLEELIEGAAAVADGKRYVSRSAAQRMADSLSCTPLTSREIDVLSLVVAGESNKGIARVLGIELNTVKSHMTAIMTKLGANSRTQAARIAATRGLVEPRTSMGRIAVPAMFAARQPRRIPAIDISRPAARCKRPRPS